MNNEFINQLNDRGRASFETLQQLHVIQAETLQKLAALQMSFTNLNVESTVQQAKLLTSGSTPGELMAAESDLARDYSDRLAKLTSETTAIITDSREKLMAFAEQALGSAETALAPATAKPAAKKKTAAKKTATKKAGRKAA